MIGPNPAPSTPDGRYVRGMSHRCRQSPFQRNILVVGMAVGSEEAGTVPQREAKPVLKSPIAAFVTADRSKGDSRLMLKRPHHILECSPEVFYSDRAFLTVGPDDIAWLKEEARQLPRRRSRLCAHPDPSAAIHEMIIVHGNMSYVRPHRHLNKSESLHVLEGAVRAILFDEHGDIQDVIEMAPHGMGRPYFYRMPHGVFHSLLIDSDWLVFHEATEGPFDPARTEFPAWAPDGSDSSAVAEYMADLQLKTRKYSKSFADN